MQGYLTNAENTSNSLSSIVSHKMDSAIRLCYSPLPAATPRASKVHLSFSHGSLSVSHSSKRTHLVSRPFHVTCMHDRFSEGSENEENAKKTGRRIVGASLVVACVVGAFSLSSKMNPKSNVAYALARNQESATAVVKQKQSRRQVINIKPGAHLEDSVRPGSLFVNAPDQSDVEALKLYAMAISMSRPPKSLRLAERILSDEYIRWKGETQSAESLKMALIELLMDQKKYQEASQRLDELIDSKVGNDRNDEDLHKKLSIKEIEEEIEKLRQLGPDPLREKIFLYKAIVDTKLDNKEEAKKWWDAFQTEATDETRPQDMPFPGKTYEPLDIWEQDESLAESYFNNKHKQKKQDKDKQKKPDKQGRGMQIKLGGNVTFKVKKGK